MPPATDATPSRPSTPWTAAPLDPAEFTVFVPPAPHAGTPFDANQLRVRWRHFAEAAGAALASQAVAVVDEDESRGYGDEGDGWGPIPVAMQPGAVNDRAEGGEGGGGAMGW